MYIFISAHALYKVKRLFEYTRACSLSRRQCRDTRGLGHSSACIVGGSRVSPRKAQCIL